MKLMEFGLLLTKARFAIRNIPTVALQLDGQWDAFKPQYEPQKEGYETFGCPIWARQNGEEFMHKRVFGIEPNFSECFNLWLLGYPRKGCDPDEADDSVEEHGLIPAEDLPMPETREGFTNHEPISGSLLAKGQHYNYLNDSRSAHVWTFQPSLEKRQALMKLYLKTSVLVVSMTPNIERDGIYYDDGKPNAHRGVIYGWTDRGWKFFDSYNHAEKILSFDHNIVHCKRLYLARRIHKPKWWHFFSW